jgi:hypothetical protein
MDSPHDRSTSSEGNRRWFLSVLGLGATAYLSAKATGVARADAVVPPPHLDIPHSDRKHVDLNLSSHLDIPHFDNPLPHTDIKHLDDKGDPHYDGHYDTSHVDAPHEDIPVGHTDIPHFDAPHTDIKNGIGKPSRVKTVGEEGVDLGRWVSTVIS